MSETSDDIRKTSLSHGSIDIASVLKLIDEILFPIQAIAQNL
ncbi:hypothetical protein [Microcoleus sp. MON1_C1]